MNTSNLGYNIILNLGEFVMPFISNISSLCHRKGKFDKYIIGQRDILKRIKDEIAEDKTTKPILWIHASSLGEFGVSRPIIKKLQQQDKYRIVVTFFSPTGYEALHTRHTDIDHIFYMPLDTHNNVGSFLDIMQPAKAIFTISEYWVNYLTELKSRNIPTYLVSAIISRNAPFFKWYGGWFKNLLGAYTHFMVLNNESKENLNELGFNNVTVTGDPLFDNAITIASTDWHNPIIERFAAGGNVFIAGSISDDKDLQLVAALANKNRDIKFIFVPHEISEEALNKIKYHINGYAISYSECGEDTDFSNKQVLIIDYLGDLAYLYRVGKWAYVGGGFTPFLHSVIEATVYGLPVAFGPRINRKVTPNELIKLEIGSVVNNKKELIAWFDRLKNNPAELERIKKTASEYTESNSGATEQIVKLLMSK